jgi:hypothetical protein
LKPFDVFICYKKSSGKDFAEHLKAGLEELGLHSFLDSKDLPQMVDGTEEWAKARDKALEESKTFILLITPGFDLSSEVIKELSLARKQLGKKEFIYFRHRNLGRKIVLDLETGKVDLGKQQQVSFESKEELLRLAHNILFKGRGSAVLAINPQTAPSPSGAPTLSTADVGTATKTDSAQKCAMCSKPIRGEPHVEMLGSKAFNFDSRECADTYRKLKSLYGEHFE